MVPAVLKIYSLKINNKKTPNKTITPEKQDTHKQKYHQNYTHIPHLTYFPILSSMEELVGLGGNVNVIFVIIK